MIVGRRAILAEILESTTAGCLYALGFQLRGKRHTGVYWMLLCLPSLSGHKAANGGL